MTPAPRSFADSLCEGVAATPYAFCTPSLLPEVVDQIHAGLPETSVSLTALGSHISGTGPLGDIARHAAGVRGAAAAFVSFGGTTFSNQVLLAFLAEIRPGRPLLLPTNAHHSLVAPARRFGVPIAYIGGQQVDPRFESVLPPTPADVLAALRRRPDAAALVVTSPSYEGVCADIAALAAAVHDASPDCLLVVDQAWGAHLGTIEDLPATASALGADIVCESTHKLGGAPNQLGLLLCHDRRVDVDRLGDVYRELVTTSPSFTLAAHLDTALRVLHGEAGRTRLQKAVSTANAIRARIDDLLPSAVMMAEGHWSDPLKITVSVASTGLTGFAIRDALATQGIVVERAGLSSIVLLVTLQLPGEAEDRLIDALERIVIGTAGEPPLDHPRLPMDQLPVDPVLHGRELQGTPVSLVDAAGCVATRLVECYPPGVGILVPGFMITDAATSYLLAAHAAGAEVVGLGTVDGCLTVDAVPAPAFVRPGGMR